MLFNSFEFLIYFPVVCLLYFATRPAWRWIPLLIASFYFYMAFKPVYVLVLVFLILVDYFAGLLIERSSDSNRRWVLAFSIVANFGILAFFKYFKFFAATVGAGYPSILDSLILPLGLSFHTFQSVSYTIEVYRGRVKAERHLGIYALYVMFFPQLVAGPIERPYQLLPQFHKNNSFNPDNVTRGLQLMLVGFLKKVLIADRLSIFVDMIYGDPHKYAGWPLAVATFFFAFQIYCDFCGYTDIARGAAKTMGYDLMINFNAPYLATSIAAFWHRWHISLSTWFRDYLYIPLGGNRVPVWRRYINVMIVFVVSGLWHGANLTFAWWGFVHGIFMSVYLAWHWMQRKSETESAPGFSRKFLGLLLTWTCVMVSWVFFRAAHVQDAFFILRHFMGPLNAVYDFKDWSRFDFALSFLMVASLLVFEAIEQRVDLEKFLERRPLIFRWGLYYAALLLLFRLGELGGSSFIYFQF